MLLIVKMTNPSNAVRGLLRRFLVEPHSHLFVGSVTRRVAENIWESIQSDIYSQGFRCLWILGNSTEEQGYEIREFGGEVLLEDFDGFILPRRIISENP
jgi:CRISPR-associated endoribonuclease Cas2 subtype I-E